MPQDKSIPGSPQEWLARAKGSLALAKQSKVEAAFWEDQCFLAQQAAETDVPWLFFEKSVKLWRVSMDFEVFATVSSH